MMDIYVENAADNKKWLLLQDAFAVLHYDSYLQSILTGSPRGSECSKHKDAAYCIEGYLFSV